MKIAKTVWVFAKAKPGLEQAVAYLRAHFKSVRLFRGEINEPFPLQAGEPGPDICISYISPWIIPESVLASTREFALNFHPGPPEYPGIGCTNFAIYDGAESYGVTCHHMETRVDSGKIVKVKRFPVQEDESVYSLTQKCYQAILEVFLDVMNFYLANHTVPVSDEKWARKPFTRKNLNDLCRLSFTLSPREIQRRIRATTYPDKPGACLSWDGRDIAVATYRDFEMLREKIQPLHLT